MGELLAHRRQVGRDRFRDRIGKLDELGRALVHLLFYSVARLRGGFIQPHRHGVGRAAHLSARRLRLAIEAPAAVGRGGGKTRQLLGRHLLEAPGQPAGGADRGAGEVRHRPVALACHVGDDRAHRLALAAGETLSGLNVTPGALVGCARLAARAPLRGLDHLRAPGVMLSDERCLGAGLGSEHRLAQPKRPTIELLERRLRGPSDRRRSQRRDVVHHQLEAREGVGKVRAQRRECGLQERELGPHLLAEAGDAAPGPLRQPRRDGFVGGRLHLVFVIGEPLLCLRSELPQLDHGPEPVGSHLGLAVVGLFENLVAFSWRRSEAA